MNYLECKLYITLQKVVNNGVYSHCLRALTAPLTPRSAL